METSKRFDLGVNIHSIDLPDDVVHKEHPGRRRGKLVKEFPEVRLHQGDGVSTALGLARSIDARSRLLFFLDGDHSYESVLRELVLIVQAWPTASILIHDTFYQSSEARYNTGPFDAVNEILNRSNSSFKVLTVNTGLPGMTLLWRR